jgi:hypothetical protein
MNQSVLMTPTRTISKTGCFEDKLQKLIQENGAVISWGAATGTKQALLVCNNAAFSGSVLPKYFRHAKFSSFVRQLNSHGYIKSKNSPKGNRNAVDNNVWEFEKNTSGLVRAISSKSMTSTGKKIVKKKDDARTKSLEVPHMTMMNMPSGAFGTPLMSPISLSTSGFSSMANSYVISPDSALNIADKDFSIATIDNNNYNFDLMPSPIQPSMYPSPEMSQGDVYNTLYNNGCENYFDLPSVGSFYAEGSVEPITFESSFSFENYSIANY